MVFVLMFRQYPIFIYIFSGSKQIHAINFIRMGLAMGTSPGVITRSKYKKNWDFLSKSELKALYIKVKNMLIEKPMGLYNAVFLIFGENVSNMLVEKGQIFGPRNICI
jgi:hypothetical protein